MLYKDAALKETINEIKQILMKNEIDVEEYVQEGLDGVFSVRLNISGLPLGTNGKGLSQEAATASAYGELMERIQNFALYKFSYPVKDYMEDSPFYYGPDEISIPIKKLGDYTGIFGEAIQAAVEELQPLLGKQEQQQNMALCIPYKRYGQEKNVFLPARLIDHIYASNGMAAGNTYAEALVQGISEILERYVNKRVGQGEIVPPVIPIEKIPISEELQKVLKNLEKSGNYRILFTDCSMGMGLPVVGMYFIDKSTGRYFVKFGAHPVLAVAVERTITELFQGRKLVQANLWLKHFSFREEKDQERNFQKIFRDGDGVYPYSLFSGESSYEFHDCWYQGQETDNKALLQYLVEIVKEQDWTILHRDVSFLGFPSAHVIIPEISYVEVVDEKHLQKHCQYKRIQNYLKDLEKCSQKEFREIIRFLDENYYTDFDTIYPLFGIPLKKDNFMAGVNNLYFKFLLYCQMGEYEKGLENLERFMKSNNLLSSRRGTFYRCLWETVYGLQIAKISKEETETILKQFFDIELVEQVLDIVENGIFLQSLKGFTCAQCENCSTREGCSNPEMMEFDRKMSWCYLHWKERKIV